MNRITWNDKVLLKSVNSVISDIAMDGAGMVEKDAKRILMRDAKNPTGKLASEIEVKKSKFKDGGAIVQAQGPGNYTRYYASFVELGTHDTGAVPFLRPALHKNLSKIRKKFQDADKKF